MAVHAVEKRRQLDEQMAGLDELQIEQFRAVGHG
jgi:hypothetical protein